MRRPFTFFVPFSAPSSQCGTLGAVHAAFVLALCPAGTWAQTQPQGQTEWAPIGLKHTPLLQEKFSDDITRVQPTFLFGDRISGRPDLDTTVEGHAELRRTSIIIRADRLRYDQPSDLATASGNVRINRDGNVYEGPELELKMEANEGFFDQPRYRFLKNNAHGQADRIDFIDPKRSVARNATYTTCQRSPGPSWMPDWVLKAHTVKFDYDTEQGDAEGVQLRFKDVPILATPHLSFPLGDGRKTGWLPPTIDLDNTSGIETVVPFYWNIAPNRDATFFPSLMTKRGINAGAELRYLEKDYNGSARLDYMPHDRLRDDQRWGLAARHTGSLSAGGLGAVGLNLNLNRVSDDLYWSDFPRATSSLTQRLLSTDGTLSWSQGFWSATAKAVKWQTLQDPAAPIVPPYDRLPQLNGRYARTNVGGFDYSLELDYTRFASIAALTLQPNAKRSYALAQVSRPWVAPGGYITPKVQLHWTGYQFDSALTHAAQTASRAVPTFSVDSGLLFDRDATFFGRAFTQTLEPRAFYVYTPFRDQGLLPNYDSGANDFNFATVFTENAFVGNDRISDNSLLTLGLTSRLLDPSTGAEALRFSYAQRLRLRDQNVTLPGGAPATSGFSDMLFGNTINWSPQWSTDASAQYNPETRRSQRATVGARYSPGPYRVVSAAYRFARDTSEQMDVGWQWPVNDLWGDKGQSLEPGQGQGPGRWYSVGRLNYSALDRKIVDAVVGFEYDAGCWLGRIVTERLQTATGSANKRISFQLEFVGFTRLSAGKNPLKLLKENVPRYQYLRETTTTPSRFSNYE